MKYLVFITIAVLFQINALFSQWSPEVSEDFGYVFSKNTFENVDSIKGGYKICKKIQKIQLFGINKNDNDVKVVFKYNEIGYKIEESRYNGYDSLSKKINYYYDENRRIIKKITNTVYNSEIEEISYKYNLKNKLIEEITTINSNLLSKTDYIYDEYNNLTEINISLPSAVNFARTLFTYDKDNNLINRKDYADNNLINEIEYIYSK
jgi:hypothetical protein